MWFFNTTVFNRKDNRQNTFFFQHISGWVGWVLLLSFQVDFLVVCCFFFFPHRLLFIDWSRKILKLFYFYPRKILRRSISNTDEFCFIIVLILPIQRNNLFNFCCCPGRYVKVHLLHPLQENRILQGDRGRTFVLFIISYHSQQTMEDTEYEICWLIVTQWGHKTNSII